MICGFDKKSLFSLRGTPSSMYFLLSSIDKSDNCVPPPILAVSISSKLSALQAFMWNAKTLKFQVTCWGDFNCHSVLRRMSYKCWENILDMCLGNICLYFKYLFKYFHWSRNPSICPPRHLAQSCPVQQAWVIFLCGLELGYYSNKQTKPTETSPHTHIKTKTPGVTETS